MFNLGLSELLILAVIALIFIGPKELPEIARVIGRMLNEFRRATGDLKSTLLEPQQQSREGLRRTAHEITEPLPPHQGDVITDPNVPTDVHGKPLPAPAAEPAAQAASGEGKDEPEVKS